MIPASANAPAALTTLLWYPDRPIAFLAARLRITHPGAVQLVDRLGLLYDIFIAIGSILLMVGFLATAGIVIDPDRKSVV